MLLINGINYRSLKQNVIIVVFISVYGSPGKFSRQEVAPGNLRSLPHNFCSFKQYCFLQKFCATLYI